MIKVLWGVEDGQPKGRITLDEEGGRRKIVFINRSYYGRMPKNGEVTDAEIIRDTKPEDLGKGALIVRPIFLPNPDALSREDAHAKMLALILADGLHLGETYIDVDLPGWKGELWGRLPQRSECGALGMGWLFRGTDDGDLMAVSNTSAGTVLVTTGISMRHGKSKVIDWKQAVKDLGTPTSITPLNSDTAEVFWEDDHNQKFYAQVSKDVACAEGYSFTDLRLVHGKVLATVSLFKGTWIITDEGLTDRERLDSQTGALTRAGFTGRFTHWLTPAICTQIAAILRSTLHSADWHKQSRLAEELSTDAEWRQSFWVTARKLRGMLEDPLFNRSQFDQALREVDWVHTQVKHLSAVEPHFESPGNPLIYGQGTPDDSAEVARLAHDNLAAITQMDAEAAALHAEVALIPAKHADPALLTSARAAAEGLRTELDRLAGSTAGTNEAKFNVLDVTRAQRCVDHVIALLAGGGLIDDKLYELDRTRRLVKSIFAN